MPNSCYFIPTSYRKTFNIKLKKYERIKNQKKVDLEYLLFFFRALHANYRKISEITVTGFFLDRRKSFEIKC